MDSIPVIPIKYVPWDHTRTVIIVCTFLLVLTYVSVFLRLWTRTMITRNVGADDVFMVISLITFTCFTVMTMTISRTVGGKESVSFDQMTTAANLLLAAEAFYIMTMAIFKVSLAFFFLRLLVNPLQRRVVISAVSFFFVFSVAYTLFCIFQCGLPAGQSFWRKRLASQCVSDKSEMIFAYTHASLTASTDLMFICLPILVVRDTGLNLREKLTVATIMSIGAVGLAGSLVRIKWLPILISKSLDFFYNSLYLAIWSSIEPGLGIIAGSIAITRPFYIQVTKSLSDSKIPLFRSTWRSQYFDSLWSRSTFLSSRQFDSDPDGHRRPKQKPGRGLPRKKLSKFFGERTNVLAATWRRQKRNFEASFGVGEGAFGVGVSEIQQSVSSYRDETQVSNGSHSSSRKGQRRSGPPKREHSESKRESSYQDEVKALPIKHEAPPPQRVRSHPQRPQSPPQRVQSPPHRVRSPSLNAQLPRPARTRTHSSDLQGFSPDSSWSQQSSSTRINPLHQNPARAETSQPTSISNWRYETRPQSAGVNTVADELREWRRQRGISEEVVQIPPRSSDGLSMSLFNSSNPSRRLPTMYESTPRRSNPTSSEHGSRNVVSDILSDESTQVNSNSHASYLRTSWHSCSTEETDPDFL